MTKLSNVCSAYPVKNQINFFGGQNNHFDDCAIIHAEHQKIQPFILKSGNSVNEQPNDNGTNSKLKSHCNGVKYVWMLKYGAQEFLPHHMNSILV